MVKLKPLVVKIPENVKVTLSGGVIKMVGPKGQLQHTVEKDISVAIKDNEILIERTRDDKRARALHGLTQALIANAIEGVTSGFTKELELSGVGFRAQVSDDTLILSVGFSHPVKLKAPAGVSFTVSENRITVLGIDKQLVGQVAAEVRAIKPPEPYKGKGIRYVGERIRRKAGKAAVKAAVLKA